MKNAIKSGLIHKSKKQIAIAVAISLVCAIPISTFAQVLKFSIKKSNTSIQSVLQELEKGSEYTFSIMIIKWS